MRTAVLALLVCAASCAKRDLDGVCKLAQEVLAEPRLEPEERQARFAEQLRYNAFSTEVQELLRAVAVAPPADKANLFEKGASDILGRPWSCAPLRIVLSQ